jgi:hypothetical protein
MRGCRSLSNADREIDGLDDLATDPEQAMFDLALDREERRGEQGYMSPAQARAFLQAARELDIAHSPMPDPNPIARAYFRNVEQRAEPAEPQTDEPQHDVASDHDHASEASAAGQLAAVQTDHLVELLDTLRDAGVVPQAPRALLGKPAGGAERLERIRAAMRAARERDELAYLRRGEELAYLANTLISGCSIQGRPMTAQEASDAAVAVCNLGLEHWPSHWSTAAPGDASAGSARAETLPNDFLVSCDLIRVFQVGWSVQYREVCVAAAERLFEVLGSLAPGDSEFQEGIETLRGELSQGLRECRPWRARDAIDVIAGLDMIAWYGLLGLIDEYPVLHAAVRATQGRRLLRVSPTDFEFISEVAQMTLVRQFLKALPESLSP